MRVLFLLLLLMILTLPSFALTQRIGAPSTQHPTIQDDNIESILLLLSSIRCTQRMNAGGRDCSWSVVVRTPNRPRVLPTNHFTAINFHLLEYIPADQRGRKYPPRHACTTLHQPYVHRPRTTYLLHFSQQTIKYVHATCNNNSSRADAVDHPITHLSYATHHCRRSVDIAWRSHRRSACWRNHGRDLAQELRHEEGDRRGNQRGEDARRRALSGTDGFPVVLLGKQQVCNVARSILCACLLLL